MAPARDARPRRTRRLDRVFDLLDVLPQILAAAILGAAVAGFGASRIGDGDRVAVAAIGGFAVLLVVAALLAAGRDRRRGRR